MKYIQATNTGKGFITHIDTVFGKISGHSGNIYAVSDNIATEWAVRVNGVEKTLEEAQAIVLTAAQSSWDEANSADYEGMPPEFKQQMLEKLGERPTSANLPV